MTIQELYDSVSQLGFETSLENTQRFYLAANRAIKQVARIKPAISSYRIDHYPIANAVNDDAITPAIKEVDPLYFGANSAKSYYFEANGTGTATLEKYSATTDTWIAFKVIALSSTDSKFVAYKGFVLDGEEEVTEPIRIAFTGDYTYFIRNVALYSSLYSNLLSDIPNYSAYTRYNMTDLTVHFSSFLCPPLIDEVGNVVLYKNYSVENRDTILLPRSIRGSFIVRYYRKPTEIDSSGADMDAVIDLDDELVALMPLLVAAYVWADDEPAKCEYYLSLYREQERQIMSAIKNYEPITVTTNGW